MTNKSIEDINILELAKNIGYSYFTSKNNSWEDGAGIIHSYDSMDNKYIKNCILFVKKGIKEIKNNTVLIEIKKQTAILANISVEAITESDIAMVEAELISLLKFKKEELEECLENRKKQR